jgi:hypothetical protein
VADRADELDVRLSIRTTYDTKRRIAKAAAHHGMSISKYMKMCVVQHMQTHDLWDLPGRVNQQVIGTEKRSRLSDLNEIKDPDVKEGRQTIFR